MAGTPLNYTLCDSPTVFEQALHHLSHSAFLILDCEGNTLGRAGGSLSLICVGTPLAHHIYVFDVLCPALSKKDFEPLWQLFQNPHIIKIVWDGRMDFLELWSSYGIALQGVLDLQVAEVVSRITLRGEGELERLTRLTYGNFTKQAVWGHVPQYAQLHAVIGLAKCCKESGFGDEFGKDPEVTKMHKDNKGEKWMERPLSEQLLQYAAKDIQLISMLCTDFILKGWIPIDANNYNTLLRQCARYVSAHCEQGKSKEEDPFRPSGVMPLDVLTEPIGVKHRCQACNRTLSITCFQWISNGIHTWRRPRCSLCHILALKYRVKPDIRWLDV